MDRTHWIYVFTRFQGRINREPFWIGCGILAAIEIVSQWLAYRMEGETLNSMMNLELPGGDRLNNILGLAFTYPEFALAVKRSNDRNLSPWVVGFFFAFDVALGLLTLSSGAMDPDNPVNQIIIISFGLFLLILIVELGFRRGTEGPNRFGPDPLAGKA
ncbi:MAG TPA: DUF805 domain-containing protein [Xanthobacteraceae bacterium]|jgi:uncharacterized membrane protein YhaH (DUF805 family)